ncbi:MAG: hypothetical protein HY226_01530 [Candidatus Vogelbacteria bacterium]|nr:hypothetical protein [Candidatus Vogelbacteria bacterium]
MEAREMNYKTRKWKTYVALVGSGDEPPHAVQYKGPLIMCNSESPMAEELGENPLRFYWDYELMAADIDPDIGACGFFLSEDWKGHKRGALVVSVYTGVKKVPMTFTWMVEELE